MRFLLITLTILIVFSQMVSAAVNPLETTMVLTNQIGYNQRDTKSFLVQSPEIDVPVDFSVKDKADGKTVFQGKLQPLGKEKSWSGSWTKLSYWKGDFTKLDKAGRYVVQVGDSVSPSFTVGPDALFRGIAPHSGLTFFKADRYSNGGWKSDGVPSEDCVLFCTAAGAYGLIRAYEADPAFWKEQGKSEAMLEEIRWGMKGLIFAQEQEKNGRFVGTNPDGRNDKYSGLGIAALARLARAPYMTPEERADCLKCAKKSWEYYKGHIDLLEDPPFSSVAHGVMVLGNVELYETEKDQRYLDAAAEEATTAVKWWNHWWPHPGGWGMEHWQGGIMPGCLMDFAIKHPKSVPDGVKNALRRWVDYSVPLSMNPFEMPGWDRNHFLNPIVSPVWQCGENGRYITNAWALALASKWSGKPKLRTMAINNLNWVMGMNPGGVCMIRQIGEREQEGWWGMVHPGGISNGILTISAAVAQGVDTRTYTGVASNDSPDAKEKNGSPGFVEGNRFPNIYSTSEPWSPYNGWMLAAVSEMISKE